MGKAYIHSKTNFTINRHDEKRLIERKELLKEAFVREDGIIQCPTKPCIGYGIECGAHSYPTSYTHVRR